MPKTAGKNRNRLRAHLIFSTGEVPAKFGRNAKYAKEIRTDLQPGHPLRLALNSKIKPNRQHRIGGNMLKHIVLLSPIKKESDRGRVAGVRCSPLFQLNDSVWLRIRERA